MIDRTGVVFGEVDRIGRCDEGDRCGDEVN